MDPINAFVNIAQITKTIVDILEGIRNASSERQRLITSIYASSGIIATFKMLRDSPHQIIVDTETEQLYSEQGALVLYHDLLDLMWHKLDYEKGCKSKTVRKFYQALATAKWSWDKHNIDSYIKEIESVKSSLMAVLLEVQLKIGKAVLESTEDIAKAFGTVDKRLEVQGRQVEQLSDEKLHKWLSPIDPETQLRSILRACEGSRPSWFLEDERFRSWRDQDEQSSPTLLCSGHAGAGKTILAACIASELRKKYLDSDTEVAVFFCNYKNQQSNQQSATSILRSICRQLLVKSPKLKPLVTRYRSEQHESAESAVLKDETDLLSDMAGGLDTIYIIIDAYDELHETEMTELRYLLDSVLEKSHNVHLLVTSRPHQYQLADNVKCMEVVAKDRDLEKFLGTYMRKANPLSALRRLSNDELLDLIRKIIRRSAGLFLIARGHADTLTDCERKTTLEKRIKDLPYHKSVTETYNQAWTRIQAQKEDRRILGTNALFWIVKARRTLRCHELLHAVATSTADGSQYEEHDIAEEQDLLASCGEFIAIDAVTKHVTIHQTVQEYFETQNAEFMAANMKIALACLRYLMSSDLSSGHCYDHQAWDARIRRKPLLEYVAHNWGWHVKDAGEETLEADVLELLQSKGHLSSMTQALCRFPSQQDQKSKDWLHRYSQGDWFPKSNSSTLPNLHVALYFDLCHTLQVLLERREDVNQQTSDGKTAVYVATIIAPIPTLTCLLEHGGKASIQAGPWQLSPLHCAASGLDVAVTRTILSMSQEPVESFINLRNHLKKTPLLDAVERGHKEIVIALLGAGADPELGDKTGRAALHYAVIWKQPDIVKILIDHGANPASEVDHGGTPMHFAAERNDIISMEHVRFCSQWENTMIHKRTHLERHQPIHEAAMRGQVAAIRKLVGWGADINSLQWTNGSPLYQACEFGQVEAAKALLDLGADRTVRDKWGRNAFRIALAKDNMNIIDFMSDDHRCVDMFDPSSPHTRTLILKIAKLNNCTAAEPCNHHFVVQRYLDCGATLDAVDELGYTALHWAARKEHVVIADAILKSYHGQVLLHQRCTSTGETPLHVAVSAEKPQIVKRLLEAGADIYLRNNANETALDLARKTHQQEIVRIIQDAGAN